MLADEMDRAVRDYKRLRALVPLGTLRTKKDYERAMDALDRIIDEIGDDEKHPLSDLADALSVFIERYEEEHVRIPDAKPVAVLKFLMREHNIRQSDLPEIGSQGVVSEVLTGKRELNTRQIRRLAKRFGVSAAVFI